MKDTIAIPATLEAESKPGLIQKTARKQILRIFQDFDQDVIRMILPGGQTKVFGGLNWVPGMPEIRIHEERFFSHVLLHGEIGFGEAYTDGLWSTPDLPRLLTAMIRNLSSLPGMSGSSARAKGFNLLYSLHQQFHRSRKNTKENSRRNIAAHYDLSNAFYQLWLDKTWSYSSAWFTHAEQSLESAQEEKYDRLCRNLNIEKGMKVLEIGCGWGGFAIHCAKKYQAHVTAVTISQAQFEKAVERVSAEGLNDRIDVILKDYRDIQGSFDVIVSIEMLEAVGHEFLPAYFKKCNSLLAPHGRLGLQVIICPDSRYDAMRQSVDWIKRHIFPGGQLPSIKAILDATSSTGDLYLHHLENFGEHYAKTLRIWRNSFNDRFQDIQELGFDSEFNRKWNYYLAYCEAAFHTRNIDVSQLVFTRANNEAFKPECA